MSVKPVSVYSFSYGSAVLDFVQLMDERATPVARSLWRRKAVARAVDLLDSYTVMPELLGSIDYEASALSLAAHYLDAELDTVYINTINNSSAGLSLQVALSRGPGVTEVLCAVDVYSDEMRDVVANLPGADYRGVHDGRDDDVGLTWNFDAKKATEGELERLLADEDDLAALVAELGDRELRMAERARLEEIYDAIFSKLDGPTEWREFGIEDFPLIEVADVLRLGVPVT
jgi:hypothetical protein